MSTPPEILRIKRKRNEEPLQALLFENPPSRKKTRTDVGQDYVFKLARTEKSLRGKTPYVLNQEAELTKGRQIFSLPKRPASRQSPKKAQSKEEQVNPELLEMVNDYLKSDDGESATHSVQKRRKSSSISQEVRPSLRKEKAVRLKIDEEYVYDVYYRNKAISEEVEKVGRIGYVRFSEDDMDLIEDDDDDDSGAVTDDEDSNSENYYQNDYPEDEDAELNQSEAESYGLGEPSDDQTDQFENNKEKKFTKLDLNESSYMDTDGDESRSEIRDESFERQEFFPSDRGDPLAIHRDRIFGQLAGIINEKREENEAVPRD
ncbi:hypothetical protein FOA43_001388 [Brettanomyces nanus]|uniref:Transcription factor Iwr1 domain-containing protein n=1 Tax=Eeniella nana TaxID=13502 RepID=A0A875RU07_EENNA|nr:uncharacterized protein FOA43_001388 [Brettanomyces nanus]QPG74067.1 hypothetical protein FOA43_001388 [Brettanomyces nanus]